MPHDPATLRSKKVLHCGPSNCKRQRNMQSENAYPSVESWDGASEISASTFWAGACDKSVKKAWGGEPAVTESRPSVTKLPKPHMRKCFDDVLCLQRFLFGWVVCGGCEDRSGDASISFQTKPTPPTNEKPSRFYNFIRNNEGRLNGKPRH